MIYGRFNFPIGNFNMGNTFNYFPAFRPMNYTYPFFQFNNVRLPFYVPTFTLPGYKPYNPATAANNSELNPKAQAQIEEIQQMKYDSDNLQAKLNENDNINDYAKFLESNKDYSISRTIESSDGGKIYIYTDKSGKSVGSVRKDANGFIRNVDLSFSGGGSISLNENNNDGKVDTRFAMSASHNVNDKNGISYNKLLSSILQDKEGYETRTENRDGGRTAERYIHNGKEIAFVLKDKDGKIISIDQFDSESKDKTSEKYFYSDENNNGIIDANEATIRYDRDLS